MFDAQLVFTETFQNLEPSVDLAIVNGDIAIDIGLETPCIVSLLTERLAADDDNIPDGTNNRRGWWGDDPIDPGTITPVDYNIGSRLWLLTREKQTEETLTRAIAYGQEALQWLLDFDIAQSIVVTADFGQPAQLGKIVLYITISQQVLGGPAINTKYSVAWAATMVGA